MRPARISSRTSRSQYLPNVSFRELALPEPADHAIEASAAAPISSLAHDPAAGVEGCRSRPRASRPGSREAASPRLAAATSASPIAGHAADDRDEPIATSKLPIPGRRRSDPGPAATRAPVAITPRTRAAARPQAAGSPGVASHAQPITPGTALRSPRKIPRQLLAPEVFSQEEREGRLVPPAMNVLPKTNRIARSSVKRRS